MSVFTVVMVVFVFRAAQVQSEYRILPWKTSWWNTVCDPQRRRNFCTGQLLQYVHHPVYSLIFSVKICTVHQGSYSHKKSLKVLKFKNSNFSTKSPKCLEKQLLLWIIIDRKPNCICIFLKVFGPKERNLETLFWARFTVLFLIYIIVPAVHLVLWPFQCVYCDIWVPQGSC